MTAAVLFFNRIPLISGCIICNEHIAQWIVAAPL